MEIFLNTFQEGSRTVAFWPLSPPFVKPNYDYIAICKLMIPSLRMELSKRVNDSDGLTTDAKVSFEALRVRASSRSFVSTPHLRPPSPPTPSDPACLYIHVCALPILILAITRMAAHVKGRFVRSQWMGQYWQHAHCISDQCSGLDSQVWCFHWKE